jgi:hypothetical protein
MESSAPRTPLRLAGVGHRRWAIQVGNDLTASTSLVTGRNCEHGASARDGPGPGRPRDSPPLAATSTISTSSQPPHVGYRSSSPACRHGVRDDAWRAYVVTLPRIPAITTTKSHLTQVRRAFTLRWRVKKVLAVSGCLAWSFHVSARRTSWTRTRSRVARRVT